MHNFHGFKKDSYTSVQKRKLKGSITCQSINENPRCTSNVILLNQISKYATELSRDGINQTTTKLLRDLSQTLKSHS